jgi:hypothetical protein
MKIIGINFSVDGQNIVPAHGATTVLLLLLIHLSADLAEASERNFMRWQTLGYICMA